MSAPEEPEEIDDDGYPSDAALERIAQWPHTDFAGLIAYVRTLWWGPPNYWEQDGRALSISTAGWSGNESIIGALQRNTMFWLMCWQSSRRGGHYEFQLPEPPP
jgi:hypothetical protein